MKIETGYIAENGRRSTRRFSVQTRGGWRHYPSAKAAYRAAYAEARRGGLVIMNWGIGLWHRKFQVTPSVGVLVHKLVYGDRDSWAPFRSR